MATMFELAAATHAGSVLAIRYGDDPPDRPRIVHPQALYRLPDGTIHLDAVQVAGRTASGGSLPGWRRFALARIRAVEVRPGRAVRDDDLDLADPRYADPIAVCPAP